MKNLKLTFELVPSSSWQNNLRNLLTSVMWKQIRNKVYKTHDNRCAICKAPGKLHAHEVWEYDDKNHIQKLVDIIPLCYLCHGVKHFGFSSLKGKEYAEKFVRHFMKVNGCNRITFQDHLREESERFNERSHYEWQLDLGKLKDFE